MISAILSFLGGSVFRMLWGEVASWINKRLEHEQEMERLAQQEGFAAAQHARNLEAIRVQAELQVKVIEVQAQSALDQLDAQTFLEGVKATAVQTGIRWVDAWNAIIRPGVATWAIAMLSGEALKWIVVTEATASVCFAALGLYLADRTLAKRGK
jgi:hypothetical protein